MLIGIFLEEANICIFNVELIIRLFRIQYKTPLAEVCDYFQNSTLEEIARLHRAQY